VAVVLLAAYGALAYFQSHRSREAERAFQEALAAFQAPVSSEVPPGADRPAGQVFATADDKYKTAAAAFEGVERRFGSMTLGVRAKYYAALARIELEQYAEAEKALQELQTGGKDELVPDLARMALAGLYRRSGDTDRAVEAYRSVVSSPTTSLPRDYALQSLARTLEDAERYEEARAVYRELVEEYPASVYAARARARADYLAIAGQG
jgi:TolA-binding protein